MSDSKPKPGSETGETSAPVQTTSSVDITSPRARRRDPIVVKELSEVLAAIETCREAGHGRGITAILRIAEEQLKSRTTYRDPAYIFGGAMFLCVALVAAGVVLKNDRFLIVGAVVGLLGVVNGAWWYKGRQVASVYDADQNTIRQASVEGITYLYEQGYRPKRLYSADIATLQELTRGHVKFKPIVKEIVDGAERS